MAYGIYGSGGIRYTEVSGASRTGLFAADGSINVVVDDASHKGLFHPCGAYRVNSAAGTTLYDASGAYYLIFLLGIPNTGGGVPAPDGMYYPWLFF